MRQNTRVIGYVQEWALNYYVSLGAPRDKLVVGMATYGRAFKTTSNTQHDLGVSTAGTAPAGLYTRENGFLSYYEVEIIMF